MNNFLAVIRSMFSSSLLPDCSVECAKIGSTSEPNTELLTEEGAVSKTEEAVIEVVVAEGEEEEEEEEEEV